MSTISTVTDFSALVAAPLVALEDAGFAAARAFLDVVREFGFVDAKGNDWGAFRYVSITLRRVQGPDASDLVVEIPLLSLIPLPLVELRAAELEFDVSLSGFIEQEPAAGPSFDLDHGSVFAAPATGMPPVLRGAFANPASHDPLMHVKLSVAPSAFPSGITNLLQLMKEATHGS